MKVGRPSEDRARDVYFTYGRELREPGLTKKQRAERIVTRRAIEENHPGLRLEEYQETRKGQDWVGGEVARWRRKPADYVWVHYDGDGGALDIPVPNSRAKRRVLFTDREHLLNIMAGLVLEGTIDPEHTMVERGSSAIPYLRFDGKPR